MKISIKWFPACVANLGRAAKGSCGNKAILITVVALFVLAGCSKEDDWSKEGGGIPTEQVSDIAMGKLFYVIDVDTIDRCKIPVAVSGKLKIDVTNSDCSYDFEQVDINGAEYIVPKSVKAQTKLVEVVNLNLSLNNYPDKTRNLLLVFRDKASTKSTRSGEKELLSCYSQYLGKGTHSYKEVSNTRHAVLNYESIEALSDDYLDINSTLNIQSMVEMSGENFESTMKSWSFNVGASFKHTKPAKFSLDEVGGSLVSQKTKDSYSINGSFDFGMGQQINSSEAYEYYLNLMLVKKAEIALNMSLFEYSDNTPNPDPVFLSLVSESAVSQIVNPDPNSFNVVEFFNEWGTDVITQGLFGGYNVYFYGRSENSYQESVSADASAHMSKVNVADAAQNENPWLAIFKAKNSDYLSVSGDFSYKNENYFKASKSVSAQFAVGGNVSISNSDPQEWLDGFNVKDPDKWSIIGYRRTGEGVPKDSVSLLYPIEQVFYNVLVIYDNQVPNKTDADKAILNRAAQNVNKLIDGKQKYLNDMARTMTSKSRLVIADLFMRTGDNGNKTGDPQPYVDIDPRNSSKYLIYYPVMANRYCPYKPGYAFETSGDDFTYAVDTHDEYWYYALAPEGECDGIVDAVFEEKSEIDPYYYCRGDDADHGTSEINTWNHLYVKYFDATQDSIDTKITAVGFYDNNSKVNKVIASTGGSELKRNNTEGEEKKWNEFWTSTTYVKDSPRKWNEGGNTNPHQISMKLSTQTLPIKRFNESTVCHPLTWE